MNDFFSLFLPIVDGDIMVPLIFLGELLLLRCQPFLLQVQGASFRRLRLVSCHQQVLFPFFTPSYIENEL